MGIDYGKYTVMGDLRIVAVKVSFHKEIQLHSFIHPSLLL